METIINHVCFGFRKLANSKFAASMSAIILINYLRSSRLYILHLSYDSSEEAIQMIVIQNHNLSSHKAWQSLFAKGQKEPQNNNEQNGKSSLMAE